MSTIPDEGRALVAEEDYCRNTKVQNGNGGPIDYAGQELASRMVQVQSKRFYLDVKENTRGKFIKIAEVGNEGKRSQIFLGLSTAAEFRDKLNSFEEFFNKLDPINADSGKDAIELKSEIMVKENRKYYLDLKQNNWGRFLRVSQAYSRSGRRTNIAIPAQGMSDLRSALTELLEEFGTEDCTEARTEAPHLQVDNKSYFFTLDKSNRGIAMRISEVKPGSQSSITIPDKSWDAFLKLLEEFANEMKEASHMQGKQEYNHRENQETMNHAKD
uniref:Transcriptional activator protein Pur-alpha n=1 Tax=Caligus rogercresseyi TaxID=217165 RepID=C1BN23_CALRO|nr:Transcriptional activator protein Pur-alpha [Caligus rogercresseyi]